jgi:hypothetical protein
MPDNRSLIVNKWLVSIAEELDISPTKYKEAVSRYEAVGRWLDGGTYPETCGTPQIYAQGSFRLGTVVRPLKGGKESEYDIDLACELVCDATVTPAKLKELIGDRLKDNDTYKAMLESEGRRCWTLIYAESDGIGFHLDALPCKPHALKCQYGESAIDITDRKSDGSYKYGMSNPNGFADWFLDRQKAVFQAVELIEKQLIVKRYSAAYAQIDEVPDALVRTPLQRLVQVLKRHRDTRFSGQPDENDRPISVIVTALAGLSYGGERDLISALANFMNNVEHFEDSEIIKSENGDWVIRNPANPAENFAERWNDRDSTKSDAFFKWIGWLREDIDELLNVSTREEFDTGMRKAFGNRPGGTVANAYDGMMPGLYTAKKTSLSGRMLEKVNFDVGHRHPPRWTLSPQKFTVEIKGSYMRKVGGFRWTRFLNNSTPLHKGLSLRFEAETNVPKPYEIHWQVVNTGQEAEAKNGLRGGFYESKGSSRVREEGTEYRGLHWVECFVIKKDVCVARSGEYVVNIR